MHNGYVDCGPVDLDSAIDGVGGGNVHKPCEPLFYRYRSGLVVANDDIITHVNKLQNEPKEG